MIRSMTGFGAADGPVGGSRVSVEIRSVNHRFFNPSLKLPGPFARWETEVREALRRGAGRGHVTLHARIEGAGDERPALMVDEARFAAYVGQLRELQVRYGLGGEIDVATILRLPDVLTTERDDVPGTPAELLTLVERALAQLVDMRATEGARLAAYLEARLAEIDLALDRVEARAPQRLVEHRDRLRASVEELAGGVSLDPQRIAQEIAILADRMDVAEELSRFRSHLVAFREALRADEADGVGKRLGFLLQEMLREANTTGSKAGDTAILRDVLAIKEELERIREQVENLE